MENLIRAFWIINEEPIIAKLIVEEITTIGEIYPSLGNIIGDKISDHGANQFFDVISQVMPENGLRQVAK